MNHSSPMPAYHAALATLAVRWKAPPVRIRTRMRSPCPLLLGLLLTACSEFTDPATRLASDLEAGAGRVGSGEGAHWTVVHATPSRRGECEGTYSVQLDKVGALIVWCKDAAGQATVSSHSTSYHARYVATPRTYYLEKEAGEDLVIELARRDGRVVVVEVR